MKHLGLTIICLLVYYCSYGGNLPDEIVIGKYKLSNEVITQDEFLQGYQKHYKKDSIPTIRDVHEAKKLLKGIVTIKIDSEQEGEEPNSDTSWVLEIKCENGDLINLDNDNYFVAYFPTEKVILCDGELTSDIYMTLEKVNVKQI